MSVTVLFLILGLANGIIWLVLFFVAVHHPIFLSLGVLAYVLGLRHAADADHIAAIDNTTRKLMQDGARPLLVGLYFSMGHSTIVLLLSLILAFTTSAVKDRFPGLEMSVNLVGTAISAVFLLLIASLNLVVFKDIYQIFREMKDAHLSRKETDKIEDMLLKRGLMSRLLGKAYNTVKSERQMYPIGFLFGLGFDTASEVALLEMSVLMASKGMPIVTVLILPLLFAAGMSLVDTLDGVLMQRAYSWAFINPIRKIYYNLTVTAVSILVALGVGGVEGIQVIGRELSLKGKFWTSLEKLSFETLGYFIIGILLASWGISMITYWVGGYERRAERD